MLLMPLKSIVSSTSGGQFKQTFLHKFRCDGMKRLHHKIVHISMYELVESVSIKNKDMEVKSFFW